MSVEENKAIVRRWCEGLRGEDTTVIDEMLSESFKYHWQDGSFWDREKCKSFYEKLIKEKPNAGELVDIMAEGDRVSVWLDYKDVQIRL